MWYATRQLPCRRMVELFYSYFLVLPKNSEHAYSLVLAFYYYLLEFLNQKRASATGRLLLVLQCLHKCIHGSDVLSPYSRSIVRTCASQLFVRCITFPINGKHATRRRRATTDILRRGLHTLVPNYWDIAKQVDCLSPSVLWRQSMYSSCHQLRVMDWRGWRGIVRGYFLVNL